MRPSSAFLFLAPATLVVGALTWSALMSEPPAEPVEATASPRAVTAGIESRAVPDILHEKYANFDETWNLVQGGGGEFVTTSDSKVAGIAENRELQAEDRIISINGQPAPGDGRALVEHLRGQGKVVVLVEREGRQEVVLFDDGR